MILKQKKTLTNTFDAIFVGTSIINILEAIYQTKLGKNVINEKNLKFFFGYNFYF